MSNPLESHRIWHDPVVEIYGSRITPGVDCSGQAYDLANRHWYQLDVDSVVTDDDWMSEIVTKHIKEYYQANHEPPPWNTIQTTSRGTPVSFTTRPYHRVARPITEKLRHGDKQEDILPVTSFHSLRQKTYLSRAADYCEWDGKKCVFKRIEFNVDIESVQREISIRETLLHHIKGSPKALNDEMMDRFKVVPILSVVIDCDESGKSGNVMGFLMPFLGDSLEILAEKSPDSNLALFEDQLRDLTNAVWELSQCGIVHGDIVFWNVILEEAREKPRLIFIDFGDIAPDYQSDAVALGTLFDWCLEHSLELRRDRDVKSRVETTAALLKSGKMEEAIAAMKL